MTPVAASQTLMTVSKFVTLEQVVATIDVTPAWAMSMRNTISGDLPPRTSTAPWVLPVIPCPQVSTVASASTWSSDGGDGVAAADGVGNAVKGLFAPFSVQ